MQADLSTCIQATRNQVTIFFLVGVWLASKKENEVIKKFSEWKQAHVGIEPSTNQTRWEWHHNTSTPSLHLVAFCQLIISVLQNDMMHYTLHCLLHLPHTRQPICAMSSNKSSQHNSHSNTPYKLSTAHILHSFYIQDRSLCHAQ